jgi:trk system potassium uptake protein TrkH
MLAPATILFTLFWMFIGANPGSTGGGIKTTTATVAIMAVRAMLLGREDVEIFGRRIPSVIVSRSLSIILVAVMTIAVFLMILLATQPLPFEKLAFEAVSAFGTVGLSMGVTARLDGVGRVCLILLMFAGRIGPLTLAMAIGERMGAKQYGLPEGRIAVG